MPVPVTKSSIRLVPDARRVISKRFNPGGEFTGDGGSRLDRVLARILALPEAEVVRSLDETRVRFEGRHKDLRALFEGGFATVAGSVPHAGDLSPERRLLIGAYFSHEYSIETAALTNPSMVVAPDQSGLALGETRFVLSLRSIGEGHISSIQFRSGVVDARGVVRMEPMTGYATTAARRAPLYEKDLFHAKLVELQSDSEGAILVLAQLPQRFDLYELEAAISAVDQEPGRGPELARETRTLHWLASSNYESSFPSDSLLSERVLFPAGPNESNGMEDARFVRFTREDGSHTYYATYTAFDGFQIMPQLIETADFLNFSMATLNGESARNKGIALFPRQIAGRYAALARVDAENNYFMTSDNVRFWHGKKLLQAPKRAWELIQLGNCGAPLETEAGWLVITHGVGPMRQYALGAILLDRDDPSRVIGHLDEPLLECAADERDGYVPNVVYSCGSMLAGEHLIVPYGVADVATRIATVRVADLLAALTEHGAN